MSDDFTRERFDRLGPELNKYLTGRIANLTDPQPATADLIEDVWHAICSLNGSNLTETTIKREADRVLGTWILRNRIATGRHDEAFMYLRPPLREWAANLTRGLPAPQPDPDDFVHEAFIKLIRSQAFAAADNPLAYAFTTVQNLVIDHRRRSVREAAAITRLSPTFPAELETSPERLDKIVQRAGLSDKERCMLFQVVYEQRSATKAQQCCGGPPGSPYYVLDKIFDKLALAWGLERSRT